MAEQFNLPMLLNIRYASGETEIVNMERVERIRFRNNGATVIARNYILAEIVEFGSLEQGPYAWASQLCDSLNMKIRRVMGAGKQV